MKTLRLPEATRRLAAAGAVCLLAVLPAFATTLMRMDTAALTRAANRVVYARATDQRVYWNAAGTQILTDTTFQVLDEAKGNGPSSITVTLLGGRIDPVEMSADGTPTFKVGEEVVLFATPGENGAHNLAGYSQGVLRVQIEPGTGRRMAVSALAGANILEPSGAGLRSVQPGAMRVELDTLLNEVRSIAAGGAPPSGPARPKTLQMREIPGGGKN